MWKRLKERIAKLTLLRSLRVRIFLLLMIMGIIPGVMMRVMLLQNYEERAVSVKISEVSNQFKIIANHLIRYNYLQDTSSDVINAELDQISTLYDGRVLIINSSFRVIKDTYGISEGKTIISEDVMRCFKGEDTTHYDGEDGFIEMTIPIQDVLEEELTDKKAGRVPVKGVLLCSISTDTIALTINILQKKAFVLAMVMNILILMTSMAVSYFLLVPFQKVTRAISEVKEGYTDEALSVPDYEETEHIVDAFNQVLSRMRTLDQSRQEFVSNVSHELKTPLASMKVLADSLLMQEDASKELYQEFMEDIAEEIERENKIINDLLSLVKLDKTNGELNISTVDINELLELLMKRLRPIARKQNIEVVLESNRPVTAEVDEVKITLALSNLVENAIKYNRENGWVRVNLDADHQFFSVAVTDSGIGIPEAEFEQIYERFYRVDKSHSREIGGTGLGLSITRNVVLMHRGSIQVSSVEQEGTTFLVKIPLTYSK
ncbi:MAG: cell wall metabolism sensor histidine kinase WalK [Lachnospiraceae bacterium]|nr:cell wall metabolism sensor histidine kinase WalK [Lachnospiraceae bacterium]MDD7027703.1 ATP-binding protein [Lachnospiraceae bacterium]